MFKTWVTEALGVKYPIFQGAMQGLAQSGLAAAVSNAGGLGIITSLNSNTADEFRQEIRKMKSLTDKPFIVNISLIPTRRLVNREEYIVAAIEEGVKIFETSGRSPEPYLELFRSAKATIIHKVTRVKDAITAERLGVDAITFQGAEAGGHTGTADVSTLVSIPVCVDTVKLPVIAAGGFGDGRGLAAALALGAQGILMGTRFMTSQECPLHPKIKELLLQNHETDTIVFGHSLKDPQRVLKTEFALKVQAMEAKGATLDDLFPFINGERTRRSYVTGETNDSVIYCGQALGLTRKVLTVKEIIDGIIAEAEAVGKRLRQAGL